MAYTPTCQWIVYNHSCCDRTHNWKLKESYRCILITHVARTTFYQLANIKWASRDTRLEYSLLIYPSTYYDPVRWYRMWMVIVIRREIQTYDCLWPLRHSYPMIHFNWPLCMSRWEFAGRTFLFLFPQSSVRSASAPCNLEQKTLKAAINFLCFFYSPSKSDKDKSTNGMERDPFLCCFFQFFWNHYNLSSDVLAAQTFVTS